MKKSIIFLSVLIIILLLVACDNNDVTKQPIIEGRGNLKVVVDWDDFNTLKAKEMQSLNTAQVLGEEEYEITHVGARVVYVGQNASFAQSVEKSTAERQGIITFDIPASNNAKLFTVAVYKDDDYYGSRALWLGVVDTLQIPKDGIVEITMDDIEWIEATWKPHENYKDYAKGIKGNKTEKYLDYPFIYVRDPFQIGELPWYDELLVFVSGTGRREENLDGWRLFVVTNKNEQLNTSHTATYNFQPAVSASLFNLPSGSIYSILPIVEPFEVHWE